MPELGEAATGHSSEGAEWFRGGPPGTDNKGKEGRGDDNEDEDGRGIGDEEGGVADGPRQPTPNTEEAHDRPKEAMEQEGVGREKFNTTQELPGGRGS